MSQELEKRGKTAVTSTAAEGLGDAGPSYSPDVDIYANDDELVFAVDLPGVAKGDVNLEITENNTLIIKAKNSHQEPGGAVLRQCNIGNYYRAFQLSQQYDKEKVSGTIENGLLTVRIPKREEAKPKKIEIKA
ncbi:MAG: Hsp20 family protein [Chitinivibrionales bacterium]|nr:Hsp20 family protein [Chitinivibrionales bacterium]MBD3395198.1 Hsp20 family protein [Chitinivibrionales bacterium]